MRRATFQLFHQFRDTERGREQDESMDMVIESTDLQCRGAMMTCNSAEILQTTGAISGFRKVARFLVLKTIWQKSCAYVFAIRYAFNQSQASLTRRTFL